MKTKNKPNCPLVGQDGNIFNLIGIAARTLKSRSEYIAAVFYCLQFGSELQTDDDEDFDYEEFCECFDDLYYDDFAEITENLRDEFPQYEITYNLSYAVGKVYEYLTQ